MRLSDRMVSEDGASTYSVSDVALAELPDMDENLRSAGFPSTLSCNLLHAYSSFQSPSAADCETPWPSSSRCPCAKWRGGSGKGGGC